MSSAAASYASAYEGFISPSEDAAPMQNASSSDSDHALNQDHDAPNDGSDNDSSDGDASTASASEAEGSGRRRRRQRIHFGVEQLQAVYHLPLKTVRLVWTLGRALIDTPPPELRVVEYSTTCCQWIVPVLTPELLQAAECLGICEAALKRICRRNRIRKWPYRQLSSVRRRIAELKDQRVALSASRVGGERVSDHHTEATASPELLAARLRQLEAEQINVIRSAHRPKKSSSGQRSSATSWLQHHRRPVPGEALTILLRGYDSTAEQPTPLDLRRVDRDFPLLFLANVCESVRALHST